MEWTACGLYAWLLFLSSVLQGSIDVVNWCGAVFLLRLNRNLEMAQGLCLFTRPPVFVFFPPLGYYDDPQMHRQSKTLAWLFPTVLHRVGLASGPLSASTSLPPPSMNLTLMFTSVLFCGPLRSRWATCAAVGLELPTVTWWSLQWDHEPKTVAPPLPQLSVAHGSVAQTRPFSVSSSPSLTGDKAGLVWTSTGNHSCCEFIIATIVLKGWHFIVLHPLLWLLQEDNSLLCRFS